jgi:hypothetical protein
LLESEGLHFCDEFGGLEEIIFDVVEAPAVDDPCDSGHPLSVLWVFGEITPLIEVLGQKLLHAGSSDILHCISFHHAGHQHSVVVESPRVDIWLGEETT